MAENEDLEYNPFLSALQKRFPKLYERVQDACFLVCVPHSRCLQNFKPSLQVFEKYVFQPSPFFKNEWESISKPPIKIKLLDGEGGALQVTFPTGERASVKIMFEETYYNKGFQPHRMMCIERFFDAPPSAESSSPPQTRKDDIFESRSTFRDHEQFLSAYTGVTKQLVDLTTLFNRSYVVVPGYLEHLTNRLQSMRDELFEVAIASPKLAHVRADPRLPNVINDALECCICEKVIVLNARSFL